ncbi:MAG: ATP-binding protein [Planctomycetaceae bacterium]
MSDEVIIHGSAPRAVTEKIQIEGPDLRLSTLIAPTHTACIGLLRDRLMSSLQDFRVMAESMGHQFCMALDEALANAFFHGNLELSSSLKEDGSDTFTKIAEERQLQSPWKDRSVTVTELASSFGVWITIRDEGSGFDVAGTLNRPPNPEQLLASGRGLLIMKAFCDEVIYNRDGNEVTLVAYPQQNLEVHEFLAHCKTKRGNAQKTPAES